MNLAKWESYAGRHRGAVFAVVGGAAGVIQAWHSRGDLSPDLINYLALVRILLTNGWTSSISGFWSPLYSWVLAVPMSLHLVSSRTELLWVHIINLGIFFLAMLCFYVLLNHTLKLTAMRVGANCERWARIETLWYFTACAIFLFVVFEWLPNSLCNPDLLAASFIFLSAGFFASMLCGDRSWPRYFVLGAALALGYLAKASAFPLAVLFLVMLFVVNRKQKWESMKCLVTIAAFALVAGPFLYTLSTKEAHITFGESGRIAYLMYGNGVPAYWLGEGLSREGNTPGFERVCSDPAVLAFRGAPAGVYLPSFEPSRWYAGLVPRLRLTREAQNLRAGLTTLAGMATAETDLILGIVLLLLLSGWSKGLRSIMSWWFLWLPAACGTALFLIVHVEERFIAPFVVLGFVGLYTGTLIAVIRRPKLVSKVLLAVVLLQAGRAGIAIVKGFLGARVSATSNAVKIVEDLENAGVPQGARVAVIGDPETPYWAWIGRYSIVGEVPVSGTTGFLAADAGKRLEFYKCLAKAGAEAAMFHTDIPQLLEPRWLKMGNEELYMRRLDAIPSTPSSEGHGIDSRPVEDGQANPASSTLPL